MFPLLKENKPFINFILTRAKQRLQQDLLGSFRGFRQYFETKARPYLRASYGTQLEALRCGGTGCLEYMRRRLRDFYTRESGHLCQSVLPGLLHRILKDCFVEHTEMIRSDISLCLQQIQVSESLRKSLSMSPSSSGCHTAVSTAYGYESTNTKSFVLYHHDKVATNSTEDTAKDATSTVSCSLVERIFREISLNDMIQLYQTHTSESDIDTIEIDLTTLCEVLHVLPAYNDVLSGLSMTLTLPRHVLKTKREQQLTENDTSSSIQESIGIVGQVYDQLLYNQKGIHDVRFYFGRGAVGNDALAHWTTRNAALVEAIVCHCLRANRLSRTNDYVNCAFDLLYGLMDSVVGFVETLTIA